MTDLELIQFIKSPENGILPEIIKKLYNLPILIVELAPILEDLASLYLVEQERFIEELFQPNIQLFFSH